MADKPESNKLNDDHKNAGSVETDAKSRIQDDYHDSVGIRDLSSTQKADSTISRTDTSAGYFPNLVLEGADSSKTNKIKTDANPGVEKQSGEQPKPLAGLIIEGEERVKSSSVGLKTGDESSAPKETSSQRDVQHQQGRDGTQTPRMSEAELIKSLETKLKDDAAAGKFAGAVGITKNGKPIFADTEGLADRDKQTPNDPDTKYRFGSMGKMFTAVSVMQLVEAGKIKLSDTLDKYVPDFPNKELASKVTIEQLLTHTGGTGNFFDKWFEEHPKELKSIDDYISHYGPILDKPEMRGKFDYSNMGYMLLGKVIEKASGQDYYDYLQDHIYKPAGMTHTGSEPEGTKVDKLSTGYTKSPDGSSKPNDDTLPYRGSPAGGSYSTVGDMLNFANALIGHKLLDDEHTKMLSTGKVDTGYGDGSKYAYGFFDEMSKDGVHSIGHSGGFSGMNGDLKIYPESGYVVVVFSNLDPPAAQDVSHYINQRLPAK